MVFLWKLNIGNKLHISSSWFHPFHLTLEFLEFIFNVYFRCGVYRFVVVSQNLEPLRKAIKVRNKMAYPKSSLVPLGRMNRANALFVVPKFFPACSPLCCSWIPSAVWWQSSTIWALSGMRRLIQPYRPSPFWIFFSAFSHNPARWITTSFPMNAVTFRLHWEPELFHWVKDESHPPQNLQLFRQHYFLPGGGT